MKGQCQKHTVGHGPAEIVIVLYAHAWVPVPELTLQHLALARAYYSLETEHITNALVAT